MTASVQISFLTIRLGYFMLIFLHGADTFRAKEKLDELKRRFLEKNNGNSFLISKIDGAEFNIAEFRNKVLSAGFFAEKKMTIVNYELLITNYELETLEIIKRIPEENVLIIWDKKGEEKSSKTDLKKYLLKQKFVFEFNPLSGNTLIAWIRERAKNYACEIDNEAIAEICDILGPPRVGSPSRVEAGTDLWKINLELGKICAYANALRRDCHAPITGLAMTDGESISSAPSLRGVRDEAIPSITKKMVNELLAREAEDNIFGFIDALAAKNKRMALLTLEEEFRAGAADLQILGAVVRQIRILLQIKSMSGASLQKDAIAKQLAIHPYVAQKSLQQVKNFQLNELKNIYRQLLAIDMGIKTSSAPPRAMFGRMIGKM